MNLLEIKKLICFCLLLSSIFLIPCHSKAQSTDLLVNEFGRLDAVCREESADDLKLMLESAKRMLQIGQQLKVDSMIVMANYYKAEVLHNLGSYDAALKLCFDNIKMAETLRHGRSLVDYPVLMGRVYQMLADLENAQVFMKKAKENAISCGLFKDTLQINYEIGYNMTMMGDHQKGIDLIKTNLEAARKTNNGDDLVLGIDNLAILYAELGENEKALATELELLEMPHFWTENLIRVGVNIHLSEMYINLKDWHNAQIYQIEAMKHAKVLKSNDWYLECYKMQALIAEGTGDYQNALANHKLYMDMKDSVFQSQYDEKMAGMTTLYDLESKQKSILALENDQQLKTNQIRLQQIFLLLALLGALGVFMWVNNRNLKKTNLLKEAFAQDLIKVQDDEQQRISKELHDSVGQQILFIKNRLQRLESQPDPQLVASVDTALEEVRNISKDLYPNQLEQYGLVSAVDSLCEITHESSGIFVSSDLEGIDSKLSRQAKINCYRIIQESINNTIKHANASAIRITSVLQANEIELTIQDNGTGFDKTVLEQKAATSFGMINMEERIKMLRGKFNLDTGLGKGVKLTFTIPV
jgi:signal transduction histidine kinase